MGVWHFLLTVTGTNNEGGYWYGFWSGFGADLTEFAILAIVWRKINCHAKGCFRVGLHRVDGTPYITCRKHHPVHRGSVAATAEEIAVAHRRGHAGAVRLATEQVAAVKRADVASGDAAEEVAAEVATDHRTE